MSLSRLLRRVALAVVVAAGVVVTAIVGLLVLQPTLELTRVKVLFEEQLTDFVEAPVTLESVWLRPALWPSVGLRGLVIEGSDSAKKRFARLDSAELQLGLLPLLARQIRVRKLLGEGVEIRVRRNLDKSGNWPTWTAVTWDVKELKGIELRDITAEYVDRASGDRVLSRLERLEAEIGENDPLHLEMEGQLAETEYSLTARGPTLDDVFKKEDRWPLELDIEFGEARLELGGELDPRPAGLGLDLLVSAEVREPDRVAARLDLEIPPLGPLELESRLTAIDQIVTLSEIDAQIGDTDVSGSLAFDHSQEPPRLSGQLTAGYLDLEPWLGGSENDSVDGLEGPISDGAHDLSPIIKILAALSADLAFSVYRVGAPGPEIGDLSAKVQIQDGSLSLPVELVVADNTVRGQLEARGDKELHLLAALEASEVELDELAGYVTDRDGIGAAVESLRLSAESRGTTFEELIERLAFELRAEGGSLTYGPEADSEPISALVEHLTLTQQPGAELRLAAAGSLLDEAMTLSLDTANLNRLRAASSIPLELELGIAGAEAKAAGTIERDPAPGRLGFDFEIRGDRVGDLSGLLGISGEANLPYQVQGRLANNHATTRLRVDRWVDLLSPASWPGSTRTDHQSSEPTWRHRFSIQMN